MRPIDLLADETLAFVLPYLSGPHLRILDVGCGNGLIASRLQSQGHSVTAIDSSPEAVKNTNALGIPAKVATWPEYNDAPFDIILFAASLHHINPLIEAVDQAHRLMNPTGLVLVEDFSWTDVDPPTAEWFYGVVCLLTACHVLSPVEDSFVTELANSDGDFAFWEYSHDQDLHRIAEMWPVLGSRFQPLSESTAPYLYRYLCPALPQNDEGYSLASKVLHLERRMSGPGTISLIGRRFVGRKR